MGRCGRGGGCVYAMIDGIMRYEGMGRIYEICLAMDMGLGLEIGGHGMAKWDGKGIRAVGMDRRGKGVYDTPF